MKHQIAAPLALAAALAVSGCDQLPRGAAIRADIQREVAQSESGIAFYPVTRAMVPAIATWPAVNSEPQLRWLPHGHGTSGQAIAAGDVVNVTIWDSSDNSLLMSPGQRTTTLGDLLVSPRGELFLPYVGNVAVSGNSPQHARIIVQDAISTIAPTAQVVLTVNEGRQNAVDLVDGVSSPGTYSLPNRNFSVLALIAEAGGISNGTRNPRIKLQRGHNVYGIQAQRLFDDPSLDATLVPGDTVIVEEDTRFFLSLGAAGKEDVFYFETEDLTALRAIAQIGGVADSSADAGGILVLREYPTGAVADSVAGPGEDKVVFSIDLTSADGLFAAKNLQIMPGDVVMSTESPVNSLQKALSIVGSAFGLAKTVQNF